MRGLSLLLVLLFADFGFAQRPQTPTPWEDDASLNSVHFVGTRVGWAVGDRGVVWITQDGGKSWSFRRAPVSTPLYCVFGLTDRIAWAVGGGTTPFVGTRYGVVLHTRDGGKSWKLISSRDGVIPPLRAVRFFSPNEGIAAGDSSADFPSGLLRTKDGGRTWSPIPGRKTAGWRCGEFLSPQVGVVAGAKGETNVFGGGRLLKPEFQQPALEGFFDIALQRAGPGWMVGDGAVLLQTTNSGVRWQNPQASPPRNIAPFTDFRCVAASGAKVWVAGNPGTVIWHSADGGRRWQAQPTGRTAPLRAMHFTDEARGYAVGAFGTILRTADGGRSWSAVRGGKRHAALLHIPSRVSSTCLTMLVRESGEAGYRSAVFLPARSDLRTPAAEQADRLREAVLRVGGNNGEVDWPLPVDRPDLVRDRTALLDRWNSVTERRLGSRLIGKLIARIRTYRPAIVVIDAPVESDAVSVMLHAAVKEAIAKSADPKAFPEQIRTSGLRPHSVQRLLVRLPEGKSGKPTIERFGYLSRLRATISTATEPARSLLPRAKAPRVTNVSFSEVGPQAVARGRLFQGISIAAGSESRRELFPVDTRDLERQQQLARRSKLKAAAIKATLADPQPHRAAALVGELGTLTAGLPNDAAALRLQTLAEELLQNGKPQLAEATLIELVEKYPTQPAAVAAMAKLVQHWSSGETNWRRLREIRGAKGSTAFSGAELTARVARAVKQARLPRSLIERVSSTNLTGPDPISLVGAAIPVSDGRADQRAQLVQEWHNKALYAASLLRKVSPAAYRDPRVQFALMSVFRQRGKKGAAERLRQRFSLSGEGDNWKKTAAGEAWLAAPGDVAPVPVARCRRMRIRPKLDGNFDDACWQQAPRIKLGGANGQPASVLMFSGDEKFLYVAISVPRAKGVRIDKPQRAGRKFDTDLATFDRVRLRIDIDRDYVSSYEFTIDQRGWTNDRCAGDKTWNPRYFVAPAGTHARWQSEIAIPWTELVPTAPGRGSVWALGIERIIPARGVEHWGGGKNARFGLLKFQ